MKEYSLRLGEDYIYCEICNKKFKMLPHHLRRTHKVSTPDYKQEFGLKSSQPLECLDITRKRREAVKENWSSIKDNFSTKHQFKKGHKAHADRELSPQAKEIFKNNLYNNMTEESLQRRKQKLRERAIKENWIKRLQDKGY